MNKAKFLALTLAICLLAACAPSAQAIQTAVAQTQAAWTPAPTQTLSVTPSEMPTTTPQDTQTLTAIESCQLRTDVVKYTVQHGDTIFSIAKNFCLKPSTMLFGNYPILQNRMKRLRPGQVLNILPVDGVYYQWQGTETLTDVAKFYNAVPQTIINSPANHLNPDLIGDLIHPKISAGTWLVVPGGSYTLDSSPTAIGTRNCSTGPTSAVSTAAVGLGTFVWPTTEHWLSGTDYWPDLGYFGVDFAGQLGNPVYAVDSGVVIYAGWNDWGYGNLILLDHGNGWKSSYAYLSTINVSCGQNVGQGDVIGLIGDTGHDVTGPQLYFELSFNSALINPHTVYDISPSP
jgi:murein DD-endopeptidase MepM/ murein hydrolase activator NlpD